MADNNIVGAELTMSLDAAKILVMQGLAGKAPRINLTNFHWEIWNNATQSWVDTGISAVNGAPGADGADGVSPVITVSSITGGHRLTITDAEHPSGQTVDVMNGEDGYTPTISAEQTNSGVIITISDGHPHGTINSYFIPNGQDYVLTNADKQAISNLLIGNVPQLVTDWMDDNISGETTVVIDSSLSVEGAAADAAAVGDFKSLTGVEVAVDKTEYEDNTYQIVKSGSYTLIPTEGYSLTTGEIITEQPDTTVRIDGYYMVYPGSIVTVIRPGMCVAFYDINKSFISSYSSGSIPSQTIPVTVPAKAYYARFWRTRDIADFTSYKTNVEVKSITAKTDSLHTKWENVDGKESFVETVEDSANGVSRVRRAFKMYDFAIQSGEIVPVQQGKVYATNPYVDGNGTGAGGVVFYDSEMQPILFPSTSNGLWGGFSTNGETTGPGTRGGQWFTINGNVVHGYHIHSNPRSYDFELPSAPAYLKFIFSGDGQWTVGDSTYTNEISDNLQWVLYDDENNIGFLEQIQKYVVDGILTSATTSELGRWMRFNAIKESNRKINALRIGSFNIWGAMKNHSNWTAIRDELQNYAVDLIGFQEIKDPDGATISGVFSEVLASWHLSQFCDVGTLARVAATSDFVFVGATETRYTRQDSYGSRFFVRAEFRLPRWKAKNWSNYIKVSVYTTQLGADKGTGSTDVRLAEAAELVAAMQADTNPFVILTGDFNDFSTDQAVWNYIKNAGFTPMLDDTSTPTSFRGFYDNIFVNDRISIVANDIIPYSDNGMGLSDHDLLLADVVLDYSNVIAVKKVGEHCTISGVEDWLDRRQTETVTVTITPESGYTISEISTGQGDNDVTYNNGAVVKNGNTITIKPNLVVGDMWISVTTAAVS